MSRMFNPKVFQLGYVGLGCTDLERSAQYYLETLGLTETARGHLARPMPPWATNITTSSLKADHKLAAVGLPAQAKIDFADCYATERYGVRGAVRSDYSQESQN